MLKLVVNADDFGLSERVNDGILHSHRHGILTSASIMANGAAFGHAAELARTTPGLDVGVHLTLVEERPLLPVSEVPSLVAPDGRCWGHVTTFTRRYFGGAIDATQVRRELEAQIRRVIDAGLQPTHLDSHQHVHMLPEVLRVTVALAREFGIRWVRFPAEPVAAYMASNPARLAQLVALRAFCAAGRGADVARTDSFAGFFYGGRMDGSNLHRVLARLPRTGICELMCHPGYDDPATAYGHWRYQWGRELAALTDPGIRAALERRELRLTSFRNLEA